MKNPIATVFIILSLCVFSCTDEGHDQTESPNIIYVLADDLGYGDISAFNENGKIQTTNIDRIAQEGIKFTDAHTASAVCTPTRYSILTGRYNWRSKLKQGVLTGKSKALIPTSRTTVASMLQKNGYQTAFIGKWHLGWDWALTSDTVGGSGWNPGDFDNIDFSKPVTNTPNDLGFDYAYGHAGSLDMAPYVYVENGRATQLPDTITVDTGKYTWWREGPTSSDFIHEQVTPHFFEKAIDFIKSNSKEKPFFLYLALPSPHTPILPLKEWRGKSNLNPYADFVLMIDDYMGRLLAALEEQGIAENTLLFFTSDNGCSPQADFRILEEKGHDPSYIFRGHKADIYEGGHRVPFVVRWPRQIGQGQVSDQLICTTDLMATCADIIGYKLLDNEGEDSYSMLPLFSAEKELFNRKDVIHHSIDGNFAIRQSDWKLILNSGSGGWSFPTKKDLVEIDTFPPIQLYNLKKDPAETINLQSDHPEVVNELTQLLINYIRDGRSTKGEKQANDPIEGVWKQIDFIGK